MESTINLKTHRIDPRQNALINWLQQLVELPPFQLIPMQGDASFRRYFRVTTSNGSFVAMDAPPATENCRAFVTLAAALRAHGLHAPEIFAANIDQGFLLLTDFGKQTYLQVLSADNADELYNAALNALARLQSCRPVDYALPVFDHAFMQKEWSWFKEWVVEKWLGMNLSATQVAALDDCYEKIIHSAVSQPQVFMHRDYHSANLMMLPNLKGEVGILDFQDAFIGPVTYDLVSLLRDCYIDWPEAQVESWVLYYYEQLTRLKIMTVTKAEFLQWFDCMGIQRHLKALLTFARKNVRDQQPQYLAFVPRALNYLLNVTAKYAELKALHDYLATELQPACAKALSCVG